MAVSVKMNIDNNYRTMKISKKIGLGRGVSNLIWIDIQPFLFISQPSTFPASCPFFSN